VAGFTACAPVKTPVLGLDVLLAGELALVLRVGDVGVDGGLLGGGGDGGDERVLRSQHAVGGAEEGVGAGGEDDEGGAGPLHLEGDLGAFGLADPVALHLLDAVGPVEAVEVFEEAIAVGGDLEHPLLHEAALDGVTGLDVLAVLDLFVGEHGAEGGAPVHRDLGHVREALLVELEENPLGPAVVVGGRGVDLAIPVVGEAEAFDLPAEVVDVALGDDGGVEAVPNGGALGGQAEGVPAHGVEHVEALHALEAGDDVGGGVALGVADVEARARGVREHVEHVELGLLLELGEVGGRLEGTLGFPLVLPLRFDDGGIVARHARAACRGRGAKSQRVAGVSLTFREADGRACSSRRSAERVSAVASAGDWHRACSGDDASGGGGGGRRG
jgi:hypothetical protein